jgi:hypothetical protein
MKHTIKYFIKKFEDTKEEDWCVGCIKNGSKTCAIGKTVKFQEIFSRDNKNKFIGFVFHHTAETYALAHIFGGDPEELLNTLPIADVNDNKKKLFSHLGKTPRERILNFLYNKLRSQPVSLK